MAKKATSMREIIDKNDVTPMTNVNGTPVVTFEQQRDMAQEAIRDKVDLGIRKLNPDGSIAKSLVTTAAINEDRFYDNRFKLVTDGEEKYMYLVTAQTTDGYRVISEQTTGRVAFKQIPAYVFKRSGSTLKYVRTEMVSDTDFIASFTGKLNQEAMAIVLPLLPAETGIAEANLPI